MIHWRRRALAGLAALAAVFLLLPFGLRALGRWLLVSDPLQPATAVVVFGGHIPFRAMEAADIYRKGLVKEVWLTRGALHEEDTALAKLGIQVIPEHEYSHMVLLR